MVAIKGVTSLDVGNYKICFHAGSGQYFYGLCVGQAYSPAIGFTNLIIFSDSTVAEYKDTLQCVSLVLTPRQINSLRRKYYKEKGYKLGKHAKMLKFIESRNHQTTLTQAFRAPANM